MPHLLETFPLHTPWLPFMSKDLHTQYTIQPLEQTWEKALEVTRSKPFIKGIPTSLESRADSGRECTLLVGMSL